MDQSIFEAAKAIRNSEALLIGAGAGMGVDSGLPDFRGPEGFWKAYPPFRGRQFSEMSTPHWFQTDPELAWGFFGHRLNLYRSAVPHSGFERLRKWGSERPLGSFVFTSNVDGQFQKAGVPESEIIERHGSIHHLQCAQSCGRGIWSADGVRIEIDEATIRARSTLPVCPDCGGIARPNILMFNDRDWDETRCLGQLALYRSWLNRTQGRRIVAIEIGAGLAVPTVRIECQSRARILIRINPRDPQVSSGHISLPMSALEAVQSIDSILSRG
jgi:NAD-dependent SIR2 family protein deacetylase